MGLPAAEESSNWRRSGGLGVSGMPQRRNEQVDDVEGWSSHYELDGASCHHKF